MACVLIVYLCWKSFKNVPIIILGTQFTVTFLYFQSEIQACDISRQNGVEF